MNELIEELKRIHEHFKDIRSSPEKLKQFEKDIIECGYGRIKPGLLAMDDVITEEDMWIYRVGSNKPGIIINITVSESKEYIIIPSVNTLKCNEKHIPMDNLTNMKTDDLKKCNTLSSDYTIDINEDDLKNTMWRQDYGYTALCS